MSAAQVKRACLAALAHLRRIKPEARLERLAWVAPRLPKIEERRLAAKWGELIAQEGAQEAPIPQADLPLEDS
eukprot:9835539-Heterocapsa_arctica.AAC.1